ncbi:MAG TPA: CHAT domain-containing tetratricopeptide repeat protein [Chthoniobacterales bacterium]|nr:CHAT domain-containing tetratricopeptide repeat protein [Chthoniobacterales bacterium]
MAIRDGGNLEDQPSKIEEAWQRGDYIGAQRLAEKGLEFTRTRGDLTELIGALNQAGQAALRLGQFDSARRDFTEELELSRSRKTVDPHEVASALADLGELSIETWDYLDAIKTLEEGRVLCDQRDKKGRALNARILRDQGEAEIELGEFEKAETPIQEALQTFTNDGNSQEILTTQSNLADLKLSLRKMKEAEELFTNVLERRMATLGAKHPETARSQAALGYCHYVQGDYASAEPLFLSALDILKTNLGPENPTVLWVANYEGMLKIRTGQYAEAQQILQKVLDERLKTYGGESPATAESLNNLAATFYKQNQLEKTADLLRQSLAITEKKSGESLDTADTASNLGRVFQKLKKYDEAEKLFVRSLNIRQATLPAGHPDIGTSRFVLAKLYDVEGKFTQSEPVWKQSISELSERLGPLHRDLIAPYEGYALNQLELGNRDKAVGLIRKYSEASEALLANVLVFTTEEERLEFTRSQDPFSLLATANLSEDLANAVLRWKGIVLDSLLEDKLVASQEGDPAVKQLAAELKAQYNALDKVPRGIVGGSGNPQTAAADSIQAKIDDLQKQLTVKVNGYGSVHRALKVAYQEVQTAVPDRSALVEFIRCKIYQGKGAWLDAYGALIIAKQGAPKWVSLGDANGIDSAILQFREAVTTNPGKLYPICRQLYDLLLGPILTQLPADFDELIVSPDGQLNFLPLAVLLMPNGKFVGQRYIIGYVASGRDLLRSPIASASSADKIEIFANPDFDPATGTAETRGNGSPDTLARGLAQSISASVALRALPGTAAEAEFVRRAAEKDGFKDVEILQGDKATKAALFNSESPWVLHLATHALVLSKEQLATENPMHRCALAFAGAQRTLREWAQGNFPAPENDGIVLADEVARVPLAGTWLVTLSACQTGMGEADIGEGVLGLRRGFTMAGAENLLLTLWQIPDSDTAEFMSSFYRVAFANRNALSALAETQRDALVRLRQEESLGVAIQKAGPFVLTLQTGLK